MSLPTDVERDFKIFESLRETSTDSAPTLKEGQILHDGLCNGCCSERCTFTLISKKRKRNSIYVCKEHARVHCCGQNCKEKILNHEHWSCPWTGEGMCLKFIYHFPVQRLTTLNSSSD